MCSACRFIVLYICVMFGENISDSIRVMEWTGMIEALTDGQTNRPTDTQNFGRYNIVTTPLFVAGHKKHQNMLINLHLGPIRKSMNIVRVRTIIAYGRN